IQWDELRESWARRSKIPFDSVDKKRQPIAYTVVRFLTSKGWRKDADAVEKLTPSEIDAIEKGVANVIFLKEFSIRGRVYEFLHGFEIYRETGNPTGSTLMQRLEFWKASIGIIRENWLTGVGTGDMNLAFQAEYEKMHTKLAPDQRWRSHNQFLSILVGFGVFGLIWFLWAILYPPFLQKRYGDFFILICLIISFLSMITEDTIESQTGVIFFTFFYSFFLFARKETDLL
ncbi:MAG: O-antigen ligase family protein, partial [Bacteroidota bacterium]